MMRYFSLLAVVLALFACSSPKPAPTAPAAKATEGDLAGLFDIFNQFTAQEVEKEVRQAHLLTANLNGSNRAPEWSPDGQRIVFYSSHNGWWDIYTIDPDGSNETRLTRHTAGEWSPKFSPDGSLIMFTSQRGGRDSVHIMDADGKNEVRLTGGNSSEEDHVWSPDGQRILYVSSSWNGGDYENRGIYVMDADGSNKTLLTDHGYHDITPTWSPNGRKIAFLSYRDDGYELYTMDENGGDKRRLAQDVANSYGGPSWSPDGKHIVYSALHSWDTRDLLPNYEIFVVDIDSHTKTRLTSAKGADRPVWSPDGERIVFTSSRDDYSQESDGAIYIMDANGQNERKLTNVYGREVYLRWSPDGERIVFESQEDLGSNIYIVDVGS